MVETTSLREEKPKLSAKERLCLIQTINALPPTQFDELVFALNPPKGVVASSTAAQGQRSKDLLDWLEGSSGPGLAAADEVLQVLIPKATRTAPQPVAFVMMGQMGDLAPSELEAIVELLRQKAGDGSISLAFSTAGSIKLILNGSPEGLAKLQELFEAGELEQLAIPPVEAVATIEANTQDARKARLIQALRLRGQSLRTKKRTKKVTKLAFGINRARKLAFGINRTIDLDINRAIDLARAIDRDRDRDIDRKRVRKLKRKLKRARKLAFGINRAIDLDINRAIDFTRELDHDGSHNIELDLSEADLSRANLRDINLKKVDLTGATLTYADVTGTIFGDNPGLTEAYRRDLQRRGAIILDPPSSDVPALVLH